MRAGAKTIGGPAGVLPSRAFDAPRPREPQIRQRFQNFRFDLFGAAGIILLIVLWWGLTFVVPASSLPTPEAVFRRIADDFIIAEMLGYYGLPETGLLGSMIYTATNVL